MITGHLDCPRCGEAFKFTCDIEIDQIIKRTETGAIVEVHPTNFAYDHHCKTPSSFPMAA